MLHDALKLAALGWHLFPLHTPASGECSCGLSGCTQAGKHPRIREWPTQATTDSQQIERWWGQWPDANIGVATGPSRLVVLDVDLRHGGKESLEALVARYGRTILDTVTAQTGGGGSHYIYRAPEHLAIPNSAGKLGPGLDVRGGGGYIVAPPSLHKSGKLYVWEHWYSPTERAPRFLPTPIVLRLQDQQPGTARDMAGWRQLVRDGADEGSRNNTLASLAGHLLRRGVDPVVVESLAQAWNDTRCRPPLPAAEVSRVVDSVQKLELRRRGSGPEPQRSAHER